MPYLSRSQLDQLSQMLAFRCRQVALLLESPLQFVHLTMSETSDGEGHRVTYLRLSEEDTPLPPLLVHGREVRHLLAAEQAGAGSGGRRRGCVRGPGRVATVGVEGIVVGAVRRSG